MKDLGFYSRHMTFVFNTFVMLQVFNFMNARKIHDEVHIRWCRKIHSQASPTIWCSSPSSGSSWYCRSSWSPSRAVPSECILSSDSTLCTGPSRYIFAYLDRTGLHFPNCEFAIEILAIFMVPIERQQRRRRHPASFECTRCSKTF